MKKAKVLSQILVTISITLALIGMSWIAYWQVRLTDIYFTYDIDHQIISDLWSDLVAKKILLVSAPCIVGGLLLFLLAKKVEEKYMMNFQRVI